MIRVIPTTALPNFRESVGLDGVEYLLDFRWSQREERWYLDIRNSVGTLLIGCIKIVSNWPLLRWRRFFSSSLPAGEIVPADGRPTPDDPIFLDLGSVVNMCYVDKVGA